jgi:hypothetical protein
VTFVAESTALNVISSPTPVIEAVSNLLDVPG